MAAAASWYRRPVGWIELFVAFNLGFLALDVFVAHSYNDFAHPAEWIPFVFSLVAPLALAAVMVKTKLRPVGPGGPRTTGLLVGWGSLLVGLSGMFLHLESQFFAEQTLRNLVYTAPFAAPLAYSGLGLLLILNRMVASESLEWARWVSLFALGGFAGNFALSLADHAQNGFFDPREWIPVAASAFAVGFMAVVVFVPRDRFLVRLCFGVAAIQAGVGLVGFYFHVAANLRGPMDGIWENLVYGAPAFAPLLFVDLAVLAAIGLWALAEIDPTLTRESCGRSRRRPALRARIVRS